MFGDVIWHATDRLNLTFGLRWTRDEKDFTWLNNPRSAPTLDATLAQLDAIGLFAALNQMGLPVTPDTFMFDIAFIDPPAVLNKGVRSEEHTSELQSLMRISYAVFCLKKKKIQMNTKHRREYTRKHNINN